MSQPQWRKNQIAVTISGSFLAFGYTLVMPFLPMYVRQLGIESTGGIAFWSGIILGASPLIASLVGPLWGHVGDLKGMKLIATRATAATGVADRRVDPSAGEALRSLATRKHHDPEVAEASDRRSSPTYS